MERLSIRIIALLVVFTGAIYSTHSVSEALVVRHDYGDITSYKPHLNVQYEVALLDLALQKSVSKYGPYRIEGVDKGYMTHLRAKELMRSKKIENYVKVFGFNESYLEEKTMDYVRFPVYMGLLSYRTCFTSEKNLPKVEGIKNKEQLLLHTQGMGVGWADAKIMQSNGFDVLEVPNIVALYKMVGRGRVGFFCRGTNELLTDYNANKDVEGLAYDRTMAIFYPNPHFFHTHKDNKEIQERIFMGLKKAYEDGSMRELWDSIFKDSVDFVNIGARKVYEFKNPYLEKLDVEYKKYDFLK